MSELRNGSLLDGRYRIEAVIATGGMSTVYRCVDTRLGRMVAAKVMDKRYHNDPVFRKRFEREAQAMAQLSHPCLVNVYDYSAEAGEIFLIMELITGGTLRELLAERGPMPPHAAVAVMQPTLTGLKVAHEAGMVHRDIKPDNVLINGNHQIKLADFGLVRAISESQATSDQIVGTVSYLSPEQVMGGQITPATDVYSAGILLYELLTGKTPFRGDNQLAHAVARLERDVPPPSQAIENIPPQFDAIVAKATARPPAERYQDAGEFLEALEEATAQLGLPKFIVPIPVDSAAHRAEQINETCSIDQAALAPASPEGIDAHEAHDASSDATTEFTAATTQLPASPASPVADDDSETKVFGTLSEETIAENPLPGASRQQDGLFPETAAFDPAAAQAPRSGTGQFTPGPGAPVPGAMPMGTPSAAGMGAGAAGMGAGAAGMGAGAAGMGAGGSAAHPDNGLFAGADQTTANPQYPGAYPGYGAPGAGQAPVPAQNPGGYQPADEGEDDFFGPDQPEVVSNRSKTTLGFWITFLVLITATIAITGWWFGSGRYGEVPQVLGMDEVTATSFLEDAGFEVLTSTVYSNDVAEDLVVSTEPTVGSRAARGATISMFISRGRPTVPEIGDDRTIDTVRSLVEGRQLKFSLGKEVFDDDIPQGEVVSLDPGSGTQVATGTTVVASISKGAEPDVVPFVAGDKEEDALEALEDEGFEVTVSYEFDSNTANGKAIRTNPAAGERIPHGSEVTLYISTATEIPDVVGMTATEAQRALASAGIQVAGIAETTDYTADNADEVVAISPDEGEFIDASTTSVMLYTASEVKIPNTVGKKLENAIEELQDAGFTVIYNNSADADDRVYWQSPLHGTAAAGSEIEVRTL